MDQPQIVQSPQATEYPHIDDLFPYAVRIECRDSTDSSESLGSGVLFCSNGIFMVLTARHCLHKKDGTPFPLDGIDFCFANDENVTFKANAVRDSSEYDDFAILEVDFEPLPYNKAKYEQELLFVGKPFARETKAYGYTNSYRKGTSLKVEYVAPNTYRSIDGIRAAGREMDILQGFSGGGIFTKMGNRIICEGFIKEKIESRERLDEIVVGAIPKLGDDVWVEEYKPELNNTPFLSSGNNIAKIEYIGAWRSLLSKIQSQKDCSEEIRQVIEKKKAYRLPKFDTFQEQTIWNLLRKESDWSESEQNAFLTALADLGQWPSLYGGRSEKAGNIEKNPRCLPLLHRAATLSCDESIEPVSLNYDLDRDIYESVLRSLYKLDFGTAVSLCRSWMPRSGDFYGKKLMLLHLLGQNDEDLTQTLDNRIIEKPDGLEMAFIDTVIANQCDYQIPSKHSYEEYNKSGLDSPGDVLSSIFSKN